MRDMERLKNKSVLITGASAGIGAATARLMAGAGARVVLNARRADRLEALANETGASVVAGDITDPAVRARLVAAAGESVDFLINNAGYGEPGPVETVSEEDARRQFEVNFFAAAEMMRAVLPGMRARRAGHIVNISSVAGRFGYPLFGWYCATKHALEGLSDALRVEVAPWNVKVVLIEPGPVRTEFFDVTIKKAAPHMEDADSPYAPFFQNVEAIEKDFMKQATTPENVAKVVLKACSKKNPSGRYAVTGMARTAIAASRLLPRAWLDAGIRRQFKIPGKDEVR